MKPKLSQGTKEILRQKRQRHVSNDQFVSKHSSIMNIHGDESTKYTDWNDYQHSNNGASNHWD